MFEKARERHKDGEYKLLVAKVIDKYLYSKKTNKIVNTDFLNLSERTIIEKILKEEQIKNFLFYGVVENPDRSILIFYPEKFSVQMVEKNYENMLSVIRIKLPNELKYEHREFLSGIMKLGIRREKFGDIIITETGADIISLKEVTDYLTNGLKELTRFKKSEISIENIENVNKKETDFIEMKIIVSSIRLDNFVSELSKCSRTKAKEIIMQGNVQVNYIIEMKDDKKLNKGDVITIRGRGKFIFENISGETKSGRININIKKYN